MNHQRGLLGKMGSSIVFIAGLLGTTASALAQPVPASAGSPSFDSALARNRDADTLRALSADGQLLYQRERVKLTGYQYCSQSVAAAERGDFRDSVRLASKALFLAQQQGSEDLLAVSKRDLAIAYNYAGDLEHATQYAQEALNHEAKNPAQVAGPAYKTLGDVEVRRGRLPEAIRFYSQAASASSERFLPLVEISLANAYVAANDAKSARAAYDKIEPPTSSSLLPLYQRGLGNLLLIEGKPAEALQSFQAGAKSATGPDAGYHLLWATEGIARSELALGDKAAARARFVEAAQLAQTIRARFRSEEFKIGLFGDVQKIFEQAIALQFEAGDDVGAWNLSEQSRSRALFDVLRDRVSPSLGGTQDPRVAGATASLADVTGGLRQGETLVQFHSLDDRLLAWTLTRDGIKGMSIALPRADLDAAVEGFRAAVFDRKRSPNELAAVLYTKLMAPLALPAGERLIIVPHGAMHYLPFQALRSAEGFLIERHPLAIAPSASVALQLARRSASAGKSLVAFGNPANPARDDLPGAQREVQLIGELFAQPRVFVREEASKSHFREAAGGGRILHVAAHAEVDSLDPLQSRILLAEERDDPGFLDAREIYGVDLKGVSLVTLSACESGLGRIARGDEILGFTRSFFSAGAASLLVSLWPVADNSTELLMTTFYGRLANGAEAIDAIRSAQIAVLETPRYAHPFFWAPFILVGDWRLGLGA